MKNTAQKIVEAIVYSTNQIAKKSADYCQVDLLTDYQNKLSTSYFKNLVANLKENDTPSLGITMHRYDTKFTRADTTSVSQAEYLLNSLPLVLETIHLNSDKMEDLIKQYSLDNNLHVQTFLSIDALQHFIYNLFYLKSKSQAFTILKRTLYFNSLGQDKDFPLFQLPKEDFLSQPLPYDTSLNYAPTILSTALYYFMNSNKSIDKVVSVMLEQPVIHPYSILLTGVLCHLFNESQGETEIQKNIFETQLIELFDSKYDPNFQIPIFQDTIEKYSIHELNVIREIIEGADKEHWLDPLLVGDYFEDEDQAHNTDYTETIIIVQLLYGIEKGYIAPYAHLLDRHAYGYNPDFCDHAQCVVDSSDEPLEYYSIWYMKQRYDFDKILPFIKL